MEALCTQSLVPSPQTIPEDSKFLINGLKKLLPQLAAKLKFGRILQLLRQGKYDQKLAGGSGHRVWD